ncbi:hypothetical protein, partial [Acinetobacter baumannii]|uniref:hypothetical protein n=1 Tax=Acinetobacter baumannii TaxID=470 RepID=UPI00286F6191
LKQLAKQPEWSVRSCGGVVAETAKDLGITPDALSNKHHLEIDNATRQFFVAHDVPMAIDGRFLTYVLAEAANNLFVVELSATSEVRA